MSHSNSGVDPSDGAGQLIQAAGPRAEAPPDVLAEMHLAARAAWEVKATEQKVLRRRRRRWAAALVAAASLLVALGLASRWITPTEPIAGTLMAGRGAKALGSGEVAVGSTLKTAAGARAMLRLASGTVLRLDSETWVTPLSTSAVRLEQGRIYLDSALAADAVEVQTVWGTVRDVGTQFIVAVGDELEILVRDGEVQLEREGMALETMVAGEALTLRADNSLKRRTVESFGTAWDWIQDVPMPFALEGANVADYLDWIIDETGWRILYEDAALAREARATETHGSLPDVRPSETLDIVLPSADLTYRRDGGLLVIERP